MLILELLDHRGFRADVFCNAHLRTIGSQMTHCIRVL